VREIACWRRPRLVAKGDPTLSSAAPRSAPQLAELSGDAVVLAEDETHRNLLSWVRATWIVRGTRQRVMTPGTNRRRTIFGALDLASGRVCYLVRRKAASADFIALLEQVLVTWPAAPVIAMVCGNAGHPPLQDRAGVAGRPPARAAVVRGALQPPTRSSGSGAR